MPRDAIRDEDTGYQADVPPICLIADHHDDTVQSALSSAQ
jgi:hypothetical protein